MVNSLGLILLVLQLCQKLYIFQNFYLKYNKRNLKSFLFQY